jgi:hypothetical protein
MIPVGTFGGEPLYQAPVEMHEGAIDEVLEAQYEALQR